MRSCDECLLVLTDTALLVRRFPFVLFLDTRKGNVSEQNRSAVLLCFSYLASAAPAVGYTWSTTLWELPKVCALLRSGNCPWFINVLPSEVAGTDWSTETCKEQIHHKFQKGVAVICFPFSPLPASSISQLKLVKNKQYYKASTSRKEKIVFCHRYRATDKHGTQTPAKMRITNPAPAVRQLPANQPHQSQPDIFKLSKCLWLQTGNEKNRKLNHYRKVLSS